MKIALMKSGLRLTPLYRRDHDALGKLKDGEYVFEVKRDRNLLHHRKFWALLSLVVANGEKWTSPEELLIALKIKLGYFNVIHGFDGDIVHAGSIRFEVMDQEAFGKFYDACLPVLAAELECTVDELELNAGDYL